MLQVRFNGDDAVIHQLPVDEQEKTTAEFVAIRKSSGPLDGNQLEAPSSASTGPGRPSRRGRWPSQFVTTGVPQSGQRYGRFAASIRRMA